MRRQIFFHKLFLFEFLSEEEGKRGERLPPISRFLVSLEDDEDPFSSTYGVYSESEFLHLNQPWTKSLCREEFEEKFKLPEAEPENGNTNRATSDKQACHEKSENIKTVKVSNVSIVKAGSVSTNAKPKSKRYTCEVCCHRSTTKYGILMHSYLEHRGFLFLCPILPHVSNKSFKSKTGVKYHVESQHSDQLLCYNTGKYPDVVMRLKDMSGDGKRTECDRFVIKRNEVGSPKLIRLNSKVGEGTSASETGSQSSNTKDEAVQKKDKVEKRKTRSNMNTSASSADIEAKVNENSNESSFQQRCQKMFEDFSPELKNSAKNFSVFNDIAKTSVGDDAVRENQEVIMSNLKKGETAKKKLKYSDVPEAEGKKVKKKEPPGSCKKCGKSLSRQSDEKRHWINSCKQNPKRTSLKGIRK